MLMNNINLQYVEPSPTDVAKELNTMMTNPMQYVRNMRYKDAYIVYLADIIENTPQAVSVPAVSPSPPAVRPAKSITRAGLAEILRANEEMTAQIEALTQRVKELNEQVNNKT
jgi:hypothetical protein